ncbi:MAG TPA: type II secretion system protein, partial [Haliangiales bacterium]|nr:type II secretion system protein [Haliangiales bacterium]
MNLAGFGKKAHSRRAFTLIEIMVVVGVLAIVLAMGVPPFIRMMRKDSLRQAVSDIEEACSKARAEA